MEEQARDFKGVWIPKEIWLDDRLSALEKIIFTEIDSLDVNEGCYASNEYLAKFCQCTEKTVSNSIKKLIDLGYLKVVKFDGRHRFLQGSLEKFSRQTRKNFQADQKKFPAINIYNNINNNNKENIIKESKKIYGSFNNVKLTDEEYQKLKDKFKDYEERIESLSLYLASKGDKYKSHYATILTWSRKETKLPEWFDKDIDRKEINEERRKLAEQLTKGTYRT